MDADWALEGRQGLPDALRVLLETYPRAGWEADPGFDGLVRFWLERHLMFRRMLKTIGTDAEARLEGGLDARSHSQRLSRLGGMFVQELHMHHQIEDHHYFPVLSGHDTRVAAGFDMLDADHHAIDGVLNGFVEAANGALRTGSEAAGRDATGQLLIEVRRAERMLDRHLTDEEELIVPVILRYGTDGLPS